MIINAQTMTAERIAVKNAFLRAIPSALLTESGKDYPIGGAGAAMPENTDPMRYQLLTQKDFLREFDPSAHRILSLKYYANPMKIDENSRKIYQKIKSRTAVPFQEEIHTQRVAALTSNSIELKLANASTASIDKQKYLEKFREGWEVKGMETMWYQCIDTFGKTGDCAVCFYLSDGQMGWRTFGYDKGDTLYPHYNPYTGKLALLGRKFYQKDEDGNDIAYLDVWDDLYYCQYVWNDKARDGGEDGWVISIGLVRHNFPRIPVEYFNYGDVFWGKSQSLCEAYDYAVSQFCENNAAYALRILYAFGAEMDMEGSLDGTPTQINSVSTDAKVGYLEPADSSASFERQLDIVEKQIYKSSHTVKTPEIKSGADISSLTVKMMYADLYHKSTNDFKMLQPFLDGIVELFKYGYGIEAEMSAQFDSMAVIAKGYPYIFMSETEEVSNIVQLKGIGAISQKSASEAAYELGYGVVGEFERIREQENAEMTLETRQEE